MGDTLERKHDLSMFCDPESSRYVLGAVKYHGHRRQLEATDGRMLVVIDLDLGPEDVAIHGKSLSRAFHNVNNIKGQESVCLDQEQKQLAVPSTGASFPLGEQDGRWPETTDLFGPCEPLVQVRLKVEMLEHIVQYAKAAGEESVRFGFVADPGKCNGHRFAVGELRGQVMDMDMPDGGCPDLTEPIWQEPATD